MYTVELKEKGLWQVLFNNEPTCMTIVETPTNMVLVGSNGSIATSYLNVNMILYYLNNFYN